MAEAKLLKGRSKMWLGVSNCPSTAPCSVLFMGLGSSVSLLRHFVSG